MIITVFFLKLIKLFLNINMLKIICPTILNFVTTTLKQYYVSFIKFELINLKFLILLYKYSVKETSNKNIL